MPTDTTTRDRSESTSGTTPEAALCALAEAVLRAEHPAQVYDAALDCLTAALRVPSCSILLLDDDGVMRFVASRNLSEEYQRAVEGHSPWPADAEDPQPVLVEDVRREPSLAALLPAIEREGIGSLAFIPLVSNSRLLGKFMLYRSDPHRFTERELMVARGVAANVAIATQEDRVRADLVSERSHLQAMLRSSVTGVAEMDLNSVYVMVNDRFCEIVGWSREELVGVRTCPGITHPDDRAETERCIESLVEGGEQFTTEKRYIRPDGRIVWAISSFSAIRDAVGRLTGALVIVTDVTERKLVEDAIRESEERYRSLVTSLGLAVYMTDEDGYITLYNDAAVQLWGRRPVLGEDRWCGSWRIFQTDGAPLAHGDCPMGLALREDRPVRDQEMVVERPDGGRAHVLPYPTPLHDTAGRLVGAVSVLVDITELKRTQAELEEAIRAKDDFLGQVSHELRTPITQIAGNADVLRRRWRDISIDDQQASLGEIHNQTRRMQRLIENMMVLSRLERGVTPDTEPHLVQRLVRDCIEQFKERFPATRVELTLPPDLPPVETSASTVDQVIWNLLTNAQKYGPGQGPIEVTACAGEGYVEVRVLDHGPGVPEQDMARIFEPYFRSSNTPEHAAGIGLGLSVCKQLLETQGGELWAARRPDGPGMEFGLRLPAITLAGMPD